MKRFLVTIALCLGLWFGIKICWRLLLASTFQYSSKATWNAAIIDQFGAAVPDAKVEVKDAYIFQIPLTGDKIGRGHVKAHPKPDKAGHFSFQHSQNSTPGKTVVKVTREGFVDATLPICAYNPDQIEGPTLWKIMLWRRLGVAPDQLGQIKDGGGNERVTMRPEWNGSPLILSLKERGFVTEDGDFEFTIQRAAAGDPHKVDKPFEIRVRAIGGTIHSCSREDYESMFNVGVPNWGDAEPVVLRGNGSRSHPNATLHCTFRLHDGQIHGRASFYIEVVSERDDDLIGPARINFSFQAFTATGGSQILSGEP